MLLLPPSATKSTWGETEIQEAISAQVLGECGLQCGPRRMCVRVTVQLSCVWSPLGMKSIIPAPFLLTIPPQGPEKWGQKDKQLLVLLVEMVSVSFVSLSCVSRGCSGTTWGTILGGDSLTIKPLQLVLRGSKPPPCTKRTGCLLPMQSPLSETVEGARSSALTINISPRLCNSFSIWCL